jgi:hypothetical protein
LVASGITSSRQHRHYSRITSSMSVSITGEQAVPLTLHSRFARVICPVLSGACVKEPSPLRPGGGFLVWAARQAANREPARAGLAQSSHHRQTDRRALMPRLARLRSGLTIADCPQFLQLIFEDAALVAMVNLPMVRRAQARRVLDAVFPAFGKWDHVVDFTVGQAVSPPAGADRGLSWSWIARAFLLARLAGDARWPRSS